MQINKRSRRNQIVKSSKLKYIRKEKQVPDQKSEVRRKRNRKGDKRRRRKSARKEGRRSYQ